MKKKKFSEIILIILSIVIIYIILRNNYNEIIKAIINANYVYITIAISMYILYLVFQALSFYYFTKIYKKNFGFGFFLYMIIVTQFFNGITPMATGGQPLQVYELHKKNISVVDSTNIVIQHTIVNQIAVVLWILVTLTANCFLHFIIQTKALIILSILGIVLNLLFLAFLILISFSKTFNKKLINFFIKILNKLHIIKNTEEKKEKWNNYCNQFYDNSKLLLKNKKLFIMGIICTLISYFFFYSILYFLLKALNIDSNLSYIISLFLSNFITLSSSFLPIPGATGGVEYSFVSFLKIYIKGYNLNAVLLLWRFITYYLPTILGGIIFNIHSLKKATK